MMVYDLAKHSLPRIKGFILFVFLTNEVRRRPKAKSYRFWFNLFH